MIKNYLKNIFVLFLLLGTPYYALAQTKKILPLGNSLTQADKDHVGYRYHLWKKLLDTNADIDFIGSHQDNYSGNPTWPAYKDKSFDRDHEGHWGWTTEHILNGLSNGNGTDAGKLSDWLKNYSPDIVLMHLGSNDMFRNNGITETVERLREIISLLRQNNPEVVILLAQLFPADPESVGQQEAQNISVLNSEIVKLAGELDTSKSPIVLVNQNSGINPEIGEDTYDGVHPNERGEEKMAQRWFSALQPYLNRNTLAAGAEQEKPKLIVYPTLTHGQPITVKIDSLKPNEEVNLEVLTKEGKRMEQHLVLTDAKGNLVYTFTPTGAWASGLYILRASRAEKVHTAKFMVLH